MSEKVRVLVDCVYGVRMGQRLAVNHKTYLGLRPCDAEVLAAGPDHSDYWDAWDSVLDSTERVDEEGHKWHLHLIEDGDLVEVRDDYEGDLV